MDKLKTAQNDLKAAQKALTDLQDELPQFHSLLTDNERDTQRLKAERAPLDVQAQARGRVQVAREMLEQHQSDIRTAQAEVTRLEALERRELTLVKMADHAQRTTKHRRDLEKAVHEGSEVLGRVLPVMLESFKAIREERAAFALLGRELAPAFDNHVPFDGSIQGNEKRAVCAAVLGELEARGANLTDVMNVDTGRRTPLDSETRPLPNPEHAILLWQIFSEAVAKQPQYRHLFFDFNLPNKRTPVQVSASASAQI